MLKSALMMTGLLLSAPVFAAEPAPEMQRAPGTAQAVVQRTPCARFPKPVPVWKAFSPAMRRSHTRFR